MKNSVMTTILLVLIICVAALNQCREDDDDDKCNPDGARRCDGNDAQVCTDGYWETLIECDEHDMVCCGLGKCREPGGCENQ